jgi:succinyl-diaminopimelate desuccinylase
VSDAGAANVTPANLCATFNFRYSDEWHYEELKEAFSAILDKHSIDYVLDWQLSGEPFITLPGRLTEAVSDAIMAECGVRPELSTGGGTSDGRFIAPHGAAVVELGPVNATIHQADECVAIDDIRKLAMIYQHIMRLLLTQGTSD